MEHAHVLSIRRCAQPSPGVGGSRLRGKPIRLIITSKDTRVGSACARLRARASADAGTTSLKCESAQERRACPLLSVLGRLAPVLCDPAFRH
eukprot:3654861-Pleurochrysis_carterae.AAC.1